jgi:hypothetical protein
MSPSALPKLIIYILCIPGGPDSVHLKSLTCLPLPASLLPPWQCMTNNLRSSIVHSLFRLSTHHPTLCRNASRIANDSATKAAMASSVAAALLSGRVDCGVQRRERSPPYTLGTYFHPQSSRAPRRARRVPRRSVHRTFASPSSCCTARYCQDSVFLSPGPWSFMYGA